MNRESRTEVALVTGASSGIGREFALLLAAEGYRLALTARNEAALAALAGEIENRGQGRPLVLPMDLSDPEAPGAIQAAVEQAGLDVDVLVNNAGYAEYGPFLEQDLAGIRAMIQVMATAPTELTRRFLPGMVARKRGGILNVASTAALSPCPRMAVYAAIKAYLVSFSQGVAMEVAGTGVRVTALLPGGTRSAFAARAGMEKTLVARFLPMRASVVAREGYQALLRGRRQVVAGCRNRFTFAFLRCLPRCLREKAAWSFL
ncbi:MAG: SDR family NAD(P)-dependent oxidoreductase [Solidesulfovibrio sp.]